MAGLWDKLTGASLVDMSKVYVKKDKYSGHGAFARVPIMKGELVEAGIVRVHEGLDGNTCQYVFTWSEDEPRKWASGSGASVFYNMSADPNTHMTRHFDQNAFQIHACRDIAEDEELTHVYISATWRECFKGLKKDAETYLENEKNKDEKDKNGAPSPKPAFLSCCCLSTRDKAVPHDIEQKGDVQMPKVLVKNDAYGGAGAFAKSEIKKGELVEKGIIRVLDLDGNVNPYVFTWSEGEPRKWGSGSGASVFYNMSEDPNTHMTRNFADNSFEIHALRDIAAGEELIHVYISAMWRECFADMKPMAEKYLANEAAKKEEAAAAEKKAAEDAEKEKAAAEKTEEKAVAEKAENGKPEAEPPAQSPREAAEESLNKRKAARAAKKAAEAEAAACSSAADAPVADAPVADAPAAEADAADADGAEPYPEIIYGATVPERLTTDKMEKKMKKIVKEGGKRGVEIEGAADMGGLQFFCTTMDEPNGDVDLLYESMRAMNEKSDPSEEERKGGSGRIGKMLISRDQGNTILSFVAYCPPSKHDQLKADQWMKEILAKLGGGEVLFGDAYTAKAQLKNDPEKNLFVMKLKDNAITESINFLKSKGLFPDKTEDSDDEMIFGDDDFPS